MLLILLASVALLLLLLLKKATEKPVNFPPGLPRYPLVGSLPALANINRGRDTFPFLARTKGNVVGLYLGRWPAVLISDAKVIREVFKSDNTAYRPLFRPFEELRFGTKDGESRGILSSNGAEWREQRRFALRHLRDFGFGRASMNDLILLEVEKLIDLLSKEVDKPLSLHKRMNISILNALWVIVSGEQLDLHDERLERIVRVFDEALRISGGFDSVFLVMKMPRLMKIFDKSFDGFIKVAEDIYKLVDELFIQHQRNRDPNNPRDFMDVYLNEIENTKDPLSSFYGEMGRQSLLATALDLFLAGMETTASSLLWTFLLLLKHPDVQDRLHHELDRVVGPHRSVVMEDHDDLVYTQAVILESMRLTSLVPMSLAHITTEDMLIEGFNVPKETLLIPNLAAVHYDESHWREPESFLPERFLSQDKLRVVHDDHLMPFSVGKRFCLGQTLAEKEYFLFFANIVKTFKLEKCSDALPSHSFKEDKTRGVIRSVPVFDLILRKRE